MSLSLQQRIDSVRAKAALLTQRYAGLRQQHEAALQRIEQLGRDNDQLRRRLDQLEVQAQQLRVATALAPDHRDAEQARTAIAKLIREIDKCIAQLSQ